LEGVLKKHIDEDENLTIQSEEIADEDTNEETIITTIQHDFSIKPFLTKNIFFVSIAVAKYKNCFGKDKPPNYGDDCILQYFLLHTIVKMIPIQNAQVEHTSWFYTVFTSLYGMETKFQMNEFKYCLFAFWKHYQLLQCEHKNFDMWNQFFQKIAPSHV